MLVLRSLVTRKKGMLDDNNVNKYTLATYYNNRNPQSFTATA